MGYDVTFHPISADEINFFVKDVIADPSQLEDRITWLSRDEDDQTFLRTDIYQKLIEEAQDPSGRLEFESTIGFAVAAIAGYLHPYWYNRGGAMNFIALHSSEWLDVLSPISELFDMPGSSFFTGNYSAGGWIKPENIPALTALLKSRKKVNLDLKKQHLGQEGKEALLQAIAYAEEHELGILEATDIYTPGSNSTACPPAHRRAKFLKNLKDQSNQRKVLLSPASIEALLESIDRHQSKLVSDWLSYTIQADWVPHLPDEALQLLAEHAVDAMPILAKSPHTPEEILRMLYDCRAVERPTVSYGRVNRILGYLVLCNPACPIELMRTIAATSQTRNLDMHELLIRHPKVPQDIIDLFCEHKKPMIRAIATCRVNQEYLDPGYLHAPGLQEFYPEVQDWSWKEDIWAGKR